MPSTIQTSTNRQWWAPPAADPSTVTPSGTAWAASAWTEVLASAAEDSCLTALHVATTTTSSADVRLEIEIGVGAAGSEVFIASIPFSAAIGSGSWESISPRWTIPVDLIPAGGRVAVRMRKSGTDTSTWSFAVAYIEKPIIGGAIPMMVSANAPYCSPTAAEPTALAAPGTSAAWTNGAWTTIITAPTSDAVLLGYNVLWRGNGDIHEIDLANGPAGSEVIKHTAKIANLGIPSGPGSFQDLVNPLDDLIRASVRVAGRQRQSTANNASTQGVKLLLMNKPL